MAKIHKKVGESEFCILIDEALDVANKEHVAIILHFVYCKGLIRERFFKLISVPHTCSLTLKNEISKVLAQYNIKEENLRGEGYDGGSNMRGKFNGLQALFWKGIHKRIMFITLLTAYNLLWMWLHKEFLLCVNSSLSWQQLLTLLIPPRKGIQY